MAYSQDEMDTIAVTLSVSNARRIDSWVLFALVDMEVQVRAWPSTS